MSKRGFWILIFALGSLVNVAAASRLNQVELDTYHRTGALVLCTTYVEVLERWKEKNPSMMVTDEYRFRDEFMRTFPTRLIGELNAKLQELSGVFSVSAPTIQRITDVISYACVTVTRQKAAAGAGGNQAAGTSSLRKNSTGPNPEPVVPRGVSSLDE